MAYYLPPYLLCVKDYSVDWYLKVMKGDLVRVHEWNDVAALLTIRDTRVWCDMKEVKEFFTRWVEIRGGRKGEPSET